MAAITRNPSSFNLKRVIRDARCTRLEIYNILVQQPLLLYFRARRRIFIENGVFHWTGRIISSSRSLTPRPVASPKPTYSKVFRSIVITLLALDRYRVGRDRHASPMFKTFDPRGLVEGSPCVLVIRNSIHGFYDPQRTCTAHFGESDVLSGPISANLTLIRLPTFYVFMFFVRLFPNPLAADLTSSLLLISYSRPPCFPLHVHRVTPRKLPQVAIWSTLLLGFPLLFLLDRGKY